MPPFLKQLNRFIRSLIALPQKWLIIGALAFVALIITLLATQTFALSVVSTTPKDKQTSVSLIEPITIIFSRALPTSVQKTLTLNSQPPTVGQIQFNSEGTQAVFTPNTFYQPDTDYQITVQVQGVKDYSFTFHTRPETIPNLFPLLESNKQTPGQELTPKQKLLQQLPYNGPNYQIQYLIVNDSISISIWEEPIEPNKQAALEWIKTQGFDNPEQQLNISYNIPRILDLDSVTSIAP